MENSQNTGSLVSICIPVYNGEKTIRKTIESIVNQTYKNLEIIVVDNYSTDSTVEIVREFKDPRIRIIQNDIFLSVGDNWNRCFHYVNGEYMAIFHADDIYLPQIVSRQIETLENNPSVGSVFTQGYMINENDDIISIFKLPSKIKKMKFCNYKDLLISTLENGEFLVTPSAMIRTKIYQKLAPFRYEQFGSAVDFDMWLRAAEIAPIIILNELLVKYRISKTQGSYAINRLRVQESDGFKVWDFHLAQNQNNNERFEISTDTLTIYDIFRLQDKLTCALNFLYKHDIKGFKTKIKGISWFNYALIYFRTPTLFHPKYSTRSISLFFQLSFALISVLLFNYNTIHKDTIQEDLEKYG
jgi:glycosyltransferase involved in cell wall biosynthesis